MTDQKKKQKENRKGTRIFFRLLMWFKLLRGVAGIHFRMEACLFISALIDIILTIFWASKTKLPKVYCSGTVYLKRYKAYFYVRSFSDDLYSVMPGRECDVNELILGSLSKGNLFIDVGANIGYYSVLAGKIIGDSGQVVSVEPMPSTGKILKCNLSLNNLKNVTILKKAAWKNSSMLNINMPKGTFGMAPVSTGITSGIQVDGFKLDELSIAKRVHLLKIDAEGSEYCVLLGAQKVLERTERVVVNFGSRRNNRFIEKQKF